MSRDKGITFKCHHGDKLLINTEGTVSYEGGFTLVQVQIPKPPPQPRQQGRRYGVRGPVVPKSTPIRGPAPTPVSAPIPTPFTIQMPSGSSQRPPEFMTFIPTPGYHPPQPRP